MALAFHLYILPNGMTKKDANREIERNRSYAECVYISQRREFDKRRAKAKEFDHISFGERYTEKIIRQRRGQLGSIGTA